MGRATQIISASAPAGLRVEFVKCRRALRFSGAAIGDGGPVEVPVPPLLDQLDVNEDGRRTPVRYLLFAWMNGAPRGGVRDVVGVFDSEARAREEFVELRRRRPDREAWAELAALDARGNLTRLGWFGMDRSSARPMSNEVNGPAPPSNLNQTARRARPRWLRGQRRRRAGQA